MNNFFFFKIWTNDLEVYCPNYGVPHLLYIGYIDAKFEEPTHCSYFSGQNIKMPQGKTITQSLTTKNTTKNTYLLTGEVGSLVPDSTPQRLLLEFTDILRLLLLLSISISSSDSVSDSSGPGFE